MTIHPTAIVEDGARLADGVSIGPYCTVGPNATLEAEVELVSHVVVAGDTRVGEGSRVWPFASLGHQPQDLKYRGEPTRLEIGPRTMIREHVTINPGTAGGGGVTRVGAECLIMAGCHVAHDCRTGDGVVLASGAAIGGHVEIGDFAAVGGLAAIHQHVRIGTHAFVGGLSGVDRDVIPYGTALGNRAALAGLNLVGLKRRGFERDVVEALRAAYRMIFEGEGPLAERAAEAGAAHTDIEPVQRLVAFIVGADTSRRFCLPREG